MNNSFKKYGLLLASAVVALTGMAQSWTVSPTQGLLSLDINPAGCAAIDLAFPGYGIYCNREAEGYVTLYRGDELLAEVPASNYAQIRTITGFTNYIEPGQSVNISFFNRAHNIPTQVKGDYTINVPANFFMLEKGNEIAYNQPITLNYTFPGNAASEAGLGIIPSPGEVNDLSTIRIQLADGAVINSVKTEPWEEVERLPVYDDETGEETGEYEEVKTIIYPFCLHANTASGSVIIPEKVEYADNVVTLTFDYKFVKTNYFLDVTEGVINYTYEGKAATNVSIFEAYNYITSERADFMNFPITPGEGILDDFPAIETGYASAPKATFILNVPKDYRVLGGANLYRLNDDGTVDAGSRVMLTVTTESAEEVAGDTKRVFIKYTPNYLDLTDVPDLHVAPGKYVLRLSKSFIYASEVGGSSPETDFCYTVKGEEADLKPLNTFPASNSELYSISTIEVTFDGPVKISQNEYDPTDWQYKSHPACYGTLTNGMATHIVLVEGDATDPNKALFTVLGVPVSEAGEWTFHAPEEYFSVNGAKVVGEAKFTVIKPEITPTEGSVLDKVGQFKVKVDADDVMVRRGALATLYADLGKGLCGSMVAEFECEPDEDNNIVLTPTEDVNAWSGEFVLVTPAGMFSSSKGLAGCYAYNFTIDSSALEVKPAIQPKEGSVDFIDNFVLTVPGAEITFVNTDVRALLYASDAQGNPTSTIAQAAFTASLGEEPGTIVLTNNFYGEELELFGDYFVLVTPENLFVSDKGYAESYSYIYHLGEEVGIELVGTEVATFDVYTLGGVCVLHDADASALLTLDKGIYIINGKTVILK